MGELLTQDDTCMWDKDAWCHTEEWELNLNISHILQHTIACRSTWGLQSLSYKITISAVAKLIPRPPALVLNKKINFHFQACYIDWLLIVSLHAGSVHTDRSTQILSTDSNLQGCPALWSSERKSELWNLPVEATQPAPRGYGVNKSINQSVCLYSQSVYQSVSQLVVRSICQSAGQSVSPLAVKWTVSPSVNWLFSRFDPSISTEIS